MAEENLDVASAFSELTGTEIEVSPNSAPTENSADSNLENNVVDLTTPEQEVEQEQETPMEMTQEEESPQEIIESSLKSDSHEEQGDQEAESQEYENDSYDKTLSTLNETYGTDYDNLDELLDDLEAEKNDVGFANEQVEELNRFVSETGRSPQDFFKTQTQNYDEMSDSNIIKEYLSLENPELTQKEIDLFFDSTYKLDENKYNSEETELGKVHLKRDVSKARQELKELQQEYWSPEKNKDGYSEEDFQQIQQEQDQARETFYNDMDRELDDIDSLTFEINESGETFNYQLTEEDKQVVGEAISNLDDFFDPYMDKDGNINKESLALDIMAMKLQGKIIKSVASQYRSKGSEQVLRDIKNPSFEPAKVTDNKEGNSIGDQIGKQIFGDSTLWD
tara:strand:- start:1066 stop:2247 length:1182 start_codon:yes stop_codon:yes gene_type:complete